MSRRNRRYTVSVFTLLFGQLWGVLLAISTNTFVVECWHLCLISSTSSASYFLLYAFRTAGMSIWNIHTKNDFERETSTNYGG